MRPELWRFFCTCLLDDVSILGRDLQDSVLSSGSMLSWRDGRWAKKRPTSMHIGVPLAEQMVGNPEPNARYTDSLNPKSYRLVARHRKVQAHTQ